MAWTANQLAQSLATEFGSDWTDAENLAQVLAFVNDAFKTVVSYADWPWLKTREDLSLAAAAYTLSLKSSAVYPTDVSIVSPQFRRITVIDGTEMSGIDDTVTGTPQYAWITGCTPDQITLQLWPVNDSTVRTIRVLEVVRPIDLGSGSTIPVPEEMIPLIREYARYLLNRSDGDYYGAKMNRDEAFAAMERMKRKPQAAARKHEFAPADVPTVQDPRLPRLPGNYPEW